MGSLPEKVVDDSARGGVVHLPFESIKQIRDGWLETYRQLHEEFCGGDWPHRASWCYKPKPDLLVELEEFCERVELLWGIRRG